MSDIDDLSKALAAGNHGILNVESIETTLKMMTYSINDLRRWRKWRHASEASLVNLLFKLGIKAAR